MAALGGEGRAGGRGVGQSALAAAVGAALLLVAASTYYVTHRQDAHFRQLMGDRTPHLEGLHWPGQMSPHLGGGLRSATVATQLGSRAEVAAPMESTVREEWVRSEKDTPEAEPPEANAYAPPASPGTDDYDEEAILEREGDAEAASYTAFIGVFSNGNPGGVKRRDACRATWFPGSDDALRAFEEEHNVKMRFVVGRSTARGNASQVLQVEEEKFGEMVHVHVIEAYDNLKLKMMRFFTTLPRLFSARYYLKVDDDIYFRPDRLPLAVEQWASRGADYVGCKRRGGHMWADPQSRYFDPQRHLVHDQKYFLYQAGPAYALSRWAATLLMSVPEGGLRFFGGGDASFGAWFLALNVTHLDEMRLCASNCNQRNLLGYWEVSKCNGMCDPENGMIKVHNDECGTAPTLPPGTAFLPQNRQSYDPSKEKCHKIYEDKLDHSECRKQTS
eukprot:jgi/Tetstr1/446164/TSEL_003565.t1